MGHDERPAVILISGPGGAGKSSTAARIAQEPGWVHLSEDEHWVAVKEGRPVGELRTAEEQEVVQQRVVDQLVRLVSGGGRAVLELILYEDPPRPLLRYRAALASAGIPFATRILRPDVDEILRRIQRRARDRDEDKDLDLLRWNAEHQVHVLSSPHIERSWVIDTTALTLDEVYQQHFAPLVDPPVDG